MYQIKKMDMYLRVNLLGTGPCLMKKEFTGPRSHKGWETLPYSIAYEMGKNVVQTRSFPLHISLWFISVFNQLDAQTFVLQQVLFHASACFEHITQPLV